MKQVPLLKRMHGVNFRNEEEAEIQVWAPLAERVSLLLAHSGKQVPMEKEDRGYWKLSGAVIRPEEDYRFLLNGSQALPDPASLSQPQGVHGPSRALNLRNFQWADQHWTNFPLEEYIFYELHTGTFSPEGNFEGIERKLDYLLDLGVNAIELMPLAQFPGERNWGYDGVFPFAVQHSYGGAEGLQRLVNLCHRKGLAVVLDVVYNHFGPEGNYLEAFAPFATEKYKTPWGKAMNFDDAWCDGVRRYFIDNALTWFRDFHIDALRLDAAHAIRDFSPVHILKEIKMHTAALEKVDGRKHYLIVECDLNDPRYINPLEEDGYGMDAQWNDEFHHSLRVTAGQEARGYYADFKGIDHLAKSYRDAYVYDGLYSPHRHKTFGLKAERNPGRQFIVFSQNHDQVGNRMRGERTSELVTFEMQKLLAGAVICAPYLPLLFMGEEWSASQPFLYFVSHGDPDLVNAVREGRKAEFAAFHTEEEVPDPQAEETFLQSRLRWEESGEEPHATMFRYYRALLALRKQQPALCYPERKGLETQLHAGQQTLILHRRHPSQHLICLMNFSAEPQRLRLPAGLAWRKLLDSASPEWGGPADALGEGLGATFIDMQPESFIMYEAAPAPEL